MGLVHVSPAERFLDTSSSEEIYASSKALLSGFLQVMQARTIYFKYGMHPMMRDLMRSAGTRRFGPGGISLDSTDDDDETTRGESRVVAESVDTAIEFCSRRLAKLPEIPYLSRGISFGIDVEPSGPNTSWKLILHRGPLPLLQIELGSVSGFHPPSGWRDALTNRHCAHVIQSKIGSGDNVFLSLKRTALFPYSKGNSSAEAVSAGGQLRILCGEAWQMQTGTSSTLYELSSWNWQRRRFTRKFDQILIDHVGSENLDAILTRMDTRLESWLAAGS